MDKSQVATVELGKGLMWGVGSIMVSGIIGFCGALFMMYQDVAVLKSNNEKWVQQRKVSVKQWKKLSDLEKYMYTFHGKDILGIPHNHKEGE